ncbi:MAG: hypothetical protein HZA66_16365 [Rhodopseudomonas palustris]|uniref:Uncharacterized protein n=1 Tax=Rhodopseudomonas palustris TaxID=1076 RepID=A0A933W2F8_RHOPL|nr:hypothetical protein [Rhodopseudomonas palustris]
MVSALSGVASDYFRPTATSSSKTTLTRADALPDVPTTTDSGPNRHRIAISELKPLIATPVSAADNPELRDMMASNWLRMQNVPDPETVVPDNAPQNTYATVKVNGKVVATLYNGGVSMMTNDAAAAVSELEDPPGLSGPNLAQWRADKYAQLLGGTVEKASTAITQSQWTPRESRSTSYSREQLDAAFQAMLAEGQRATARSSSSYQPPQSAQGRQTDLSA